MKITHVESFLFNPGETRNLLFCRIETDSGLYGWGEAYCTAEKEKAVDEYLKAMMPHLIGRSPFNIRHTGQVLFDDFVIRRSSIGFLSAWAAIEMALWDIVGKHAGLPIYDLLGGRSREKVRVYANGWSDEPGTHGSSDRARPRREGTGLHSAEVRSAPWPMAQLHRVPRTSVSP